MKEKLSSRLAQILETLPIQKGMRILEIGCGPGALARAIAHHIGDGHTLAIDRSGKAIQQAEQNSREEIASGLLEFRQAAIEAFELKPHEQLFDLAFAIRVGALDGRHPKTGQLALPLIAKALTKEGKLFIDGGNPLREISLDPYRS